MSDARELIGRIYVEGGDGPETFDCYGLLKFVRRHYFGLATPLGGGIVTSRECSPAATRSINRAAVGGEWEKVVAPGDPGDCVLLGHRASTLPTHVGVALPGGVLHAFGGRGALGGSVVLTPWRNLESVFHRVEVWACSLPCS